MFYHVGLIGRFCSISANIQAGHADQPTISFRLIRSFQGDPAWHSSASGFLERNHAMIRKSDVARRTIDMQRFDKIPIGNDVWIGEGAFFGAVFRLAMVP